MFHDNRSNWRYNGPMRRTAHLLALIAPALILLLLLLRPDLDRSVRLPIFHFYIVVFTSFTAAVISILMTTALAPVARPRYVLAALAFAFIGAIFFTHGLATNGAIIVDFHPAIEWAAWLTLMGGGILFALAGLDRGPETPRWLLIRPIIGLTAVATIVFLMVAAFWPRLLLNVGGRLVPWHQISFFVLTLILWILASYRLVESWLETRSRVDGLLAFVAIWMVQATISMHQFPVSNLSWWLYHLVLLLSFLITVYVLLNEFEQARQFRLLPYFLAVALILTALLALVASQLFATFTQQLIIDEVERDTVHLVANLAQGVSARMPTGASTADMRQAFVDAVALVPALEVVVYDNDGRIAYSPSAYYSLGNAQLLLQPALAGQSQILVYAPGEMTGYGSEPDEDYHVQTLVPLVAPQEQGGLSLGVVQVTQEMPGLRTTIIRARAASLGLVALVMTALFTGLMLVIRRADQILTSRTEELAETNQELRRSESIREDLMNMIVHDLRNPLTVISASLDLIKRTNADAPPSQAQLVERGSKASRRMNTLIDDILTVGKIEAGELAPQLTTVPLSPLLQERIEEFAPQAVSEAKDLRLECPPDLVLQLDPALIGRVVDNLLSNAFKYTDRGTGRIVVAAAQDNDRVVVCVTDNGDGIPDSYKEAIFEKFAQVSSLAGETAVRKGTGLGLAFCRLVVRGHGGKIWVQDAPDGGSEFVFWLPKVS